MKRDQAIEIGSWVKNWDLGTSSHTSRPGLPHQLTAEDIAVALELFDPIPVTPALLEGCGFRRQAALGYTHPKLPCFVLHCNKEWEEEVCIGWWAYLKEPTGALLKGYEVSYLHQLQHFFGIVTGEELVISESCKAG